jgi:hypothetical protein
MYRVGEAQGFYICNPTAGDWTSAGPTLARRPGKGMEI